MPKRRGVTADFRICCLASAGLERQNHAFVVDAMAEHIKIMLHALDQLERHGFAFPERRITVLTSEDGIALGDRVTAMLGGAVVARALLEHPYYNKGLRSQIAARSDEDIEIPLIDGGAFDWVAKLTQAAAPFSLRAALDRNSCS